MKISMKRVEDMYEKGKLLEAEAMEAEDRFAELFGEEFGTQEYYKRYAEANHKHGYVQGFWDAFYMMITDREEVENHDGEREVTDAEKPC